MKMWASMAGGGGVGGEGSGGVSGGGDGEFFQSEMARHGDGGGESASFEGAGGIEAFVFDEDVGIFAAGQHGSEAFAERDRRGFGKDGIVAPHGGSERQQRCRRERFLDRWQDRSERREFRHLSGKRFADDRRDNARRNGCIRGE